MDSTIYDNECGFTTNGTRAVDPRPRSDCFYIDEDRRQVLIELLGKILDRMDRSIADMKLNRVEYVKMPSAHGESEMEMKKPELLADAVKEEEPELEEISEEEKKPAEANVVEDDAVNEEEKTKSELVPLEMSKEIEQNPNPQSNLFVTSSGEGKELMGLQFFNNAANEVEEEQDYADPLLDSISMVAPGQVPRYMIGNVKVIADTLYEKFYFMEMNNSFDVGRPITEIIVSQNLVNMIRGFDPGIKKIARLLVISIVPLQPRSQIIGDDKLVKMWDTNSWSYLYSMVSEKIMTSLAISGDDKFVSFADKFGVVEIGNYDEEKWVPVKKKAVPMLLLYCSIITVLKIFTDGEYIVIFYHVADPINDVEVLPIPVRKASFGAGAQLKIVIGNWSRWLIDDFGIGEVDVLGDNLEAAANDSERISNAIPSISFHLFNALSDLMMLPKDLLLSQTDMKETATFCQFWNEAIKCHHTLDVVPGFEQAITIYAKVFLAAISFVLALCYAFSSFGIHIIFQQLAHGGFGVEIPLTQIQLETAYWLLMKRQLYLC